MPMFEKHLQPSVAPQPFQHIALDTIDILYCWKELVMQATDFAGFHALHIGQVNQNALIFTIELFLNDLP